MMVLAASCSAKVKWFHVVLLLRFLDNFARYKAFRRRVIVGDLLTVNFFHVRNVAHRG